MMDKPGRTVRRTAVKKIIFSGSVLSAWSLPVVRSVILPVHAKTSSVCVPVDIPGKWQLEVLGAAASTSEIIFSSDGSADHDYINAWQITNGQLQMTQGSRWIFAGRVSACDALSGTYTHIFTIPIYGNVIIRQGGWHAVKLP